MATGDVLITGRALAEPDYLTSGAVYAKSSYQDVFDVMGISDIGAFVQRDAGFGTSSISSGVVGGGLYVLCGNGTLRTSPDGTTWTGRTSTFTTTLIRGVAYSGSLFVIVGDSGKLATSPDGITWTARTSNFGTSAIRAVTFGNGVFVAVGNDGKISTSTDGITWTARTSGGAISINIVAYGNGVFVCTEANGVARTSPDGITWTIRSMAMASTALCLTFGNGLFVAAGFSGLLDTSPDGITWTARTANMGTALIRGAGSKAGVFLVTGDNGQASKSVDGVTWTSFDTGSSENLSLVFASSSEWIIAGPNGYVAFAFLADSTNFYVPSFETPANYTAYIES